MVAILFMLFTRLGYVSFRAVMGVPGSFIFEVLLCVLSNVVTVSGWFGMTDSRSTIPQELIDKISLLQLVDIHICYRGLRWRRIDCFCSTTPSFLNSCYVPLVDHCNNCIAWTLIDFVK